jgi:purine-binding chemotaxis protein CheW
MSFLRNSNEKVAKKTNNISRYLEFNLGDERFAIPLLTVREVIAVPETTKVPFTPDYYLGVMNLRGQVLSVIDLRRRMHITPLGDSSETAVIITDLGFTHLGVVVDSINRVLAVDGTDFAPPPEIEKNSLTRFVTGCYKSDQNLVLFLDVNKILDQQDQELLAKADAPVQVA